MDIFRTLVAACAIALLAPAGVEAAGALGPAPLRARHTSLAPQLANNAFGGPLVLQSEENARRIDGEVFAVLEHPFPTVAAALGDAGQWCEILILHLNTKYCRRIESQGTMQLDMRVGKKVPQSPDAASRILFAWKPPVQREDYLLVQMEAPDGPYDTHEYRLLVEAVPLDAGHTFLHMGYALSYGATSDFAMGMYLGTVARDKVGFTRAKDAKSGETAFVGGSRGIVERNTMRYYLAIDSYLDSLRAPPAQRVENRLQAWFDATERYPRQLHEVEREAYLSMKRNEVQRQAAAR
jgi:hypothetical protein